LPPRPPRPTLFPYTTLFRSGGRRAGAGVLAATALGGLGLLLVLGISLANLPLMVVGTVAAIVCAGILVAVFVLGAVLPRGRATADRKSTRLNSSHVSISYAV